VALRIVAILGLLIVLLTGCTAMRIRTTAAAENLEHSADVFAQRACYDVKAECSTSQYLPARVLAQQTREFRQIVSDSGDRDVVAAFQGLWRAYHSLRDEVYRSDNHPLRADFEPVTHAFTDVQRDVKNGYSYADPTLYNSGGYKLDPYYN
jgi:hypothetical protein